MGARRGRKKTSRKTRSKTGKKAPRSEGSPPVVSPPVLPGAPVDAEAPTGQGGEDGAAPPDPGRGVPGEGGGAPPVPVDQVGPRPVGPPRPPGDITRPYRIYAVSDAEVALQFSEWIQQQAGVSLGLDVQDEYVGIADGDVGWHLRPGPDLAGQVAGAALQKALNQDHAPKLIVRDIASIFPQLSALLQLELRGLLNTAEGDVGQLKEVLDRQDVNTPNWTSPADAAYDAHSNEKHWAHQAPQYYKAVAIPRARQQALQHPAVRPEQPSGIRFTIAFDDLFLKILGHFTREPTLVTAFQDEKDPLAEIQALLGSEGPSQTLALILWTAMEFDTQGINTMFPDQFNQLPSGLDEWVSRCQQKLATIYLGAINAREDYVRNRVLKTLYGNPIGWGQPPATATARRLLKSVAELPAVCAAAYWNDREITVTGLEGDTLGRKAKLTGYVDGEQSDWHEIIVGVARAVSSHITVPLNPVLTWME